MVGLFDYDNDNDNDGVPGISVTASVLIAPVAVRAFVSAPPAPYHGNPIRLARRPPRADALPCPLPAIPEPCLGHT
ncbi:hypothetical protein [Candidatus Thiodictyon syntrophicum]|uniref:hypothetical protein n=1 Tax=Candidatus Thiodictyon syntrophicum TaxID=1166950 RepID=UPI0015621937|nr:hypothetical protein [Candidatus Thiodictyon syntrophicum]